MDRGYIRLFRKFFEHEFWEEKRKYSKAEAWIDLVRMARWNKKPKKFIDNRGSYYLEFGDVFISDRFLMKRWKWSKTKVRNFISYLITKESILYKIKTTKRTIICVVNLDRYLTWETTKKTSERPVKDQSKTSERPKKEPEEPVELEEPIKNIYGEFKNVNLTDKEYKKLKDKLNSKVNDWIEDLSIHLKRNPSYAKKSVDHYATILAWVRRDDKEKINKQQEGYNEEEELNKFLNKDFGYGK